MSFFRNEYRYRQLRDLAKKYNAILIYNITEANKYPDDPICFETANFGWVLSAVIKETGQRKILIKE